MTSKISVDREPSTDGVPARATDSDRREARRSLKAARVGNAAYLADEQPTTAVTREQVRSLTAQVDALAALAVG